ncbi:MAG TPA: pitrilysin family protein [Alphaproteobacteria bacterium]|nr:pitrilysin family protein [Alphaproteobacteria bacterium]
MAGLQVLPPRSHNGPALNVEVTKLPNGLTVVSDRMEQVETVSLGVWVGAGTRFETADINGISHLLEHMAFKGTKRRSARAIAEEIEAVGGVLNAYTSRELTAYYAKVLHEDATLAVDIIADILQHSIMDEDELVRERAVVLQEIGQALDTPDDIVFDYFQETAFPNQPLGRPVLGEAKLVEHMGRDALLGYMAHHYGASRMIVAASGKIAHAQLVELAADAFLHLPAGASPTIAEGRYRGGDFRSERDLEQVHVILGLDGLSYHDPDFHALQVYSTLVGGGMSSRLFQEVREKRGLVYSIHAFASSFTDCGTFGVYAGTSEADVPEVVRVVCDELRSVGETASEEEISRARAQLKASILMSLESTGARSEQLGQQLLVFGRPIPTSETIKLIEAVDKAAIARIATRLTASRPTLAALGPISRLESYESVARRLN